MRASSDSCTNALWLAYPQVQKWRTNNDLGFAAQLLLGTVAGNYPKRTQWAAAKVVLKRLEKAERLYPRFHEIYNLKGSASLILGRPEEAVRNYHRAAGHLPSPEVFTNLATGYLVLKRFDLARALLEMALRYNPVYSRAQQALDYLDKKKP